MITKHKKKIRYHLIKQNFVYSTRELALELGVNIKTILRWVKRGAPVLESSSPFLFLGMEIKEFFHNYYLKNKIKLANGEFYCLTCKRALISLLKDRKIKVERLDQNRWLLSQSGNCIYCGRKVFRLSWEKSEPLLETSNSINSDNNTSLNSPVREVL